MSKVFIKTISNILNVIKIDTLKTNDTTTHIDVYCTSNANETKATA